MLKEIKETAALLVLCLLLYYHPENKEEARVLKENAMVYSLAAFVIILLIATPSFGSTYSLREVSTPKLNQVMKNPHLAGDIKPRNEKVVVNIMYDLAKSKIEGRKRRTRITESRVNGLILEVSLSDYKNKNELLRILERWKAGEIIGYQDLARMKAKE